MTKPLALSPLVDEDVLAIANSGLPWGELRDATVLVTGANGMLPAYTVLTLLTVNDHLSSRLKVQALVRNAKRAADVFGPLLDRSDLELVVQDVTEPIRLEPPDVVVHGASAARPGLHATDPVGTLRANLLGTMNLLELCRRGSASRLVLMSSAEVYGHQGDPQRLIGEQDYGGLDILRPRACYSEGKRAAESLCTAYQAQHGVQTFIARFGHVYGPGLALDDGRVQADFAADVLAGRDIALNSDGSARRTYTYVSDAVAGMFRVLLTGEPTAYNVADPNGFVSIRELAEVFARARPRRGTTLRFTDPADRDHFGAATGQGLDSGKLASLGWRPEVDLQTGVDRMLANFEWLAG